MNPIEALYLTLIMKRIFQSLLYSMLLTVVLFGLVILITVAAYVLESLVVVVGVLFSINFILVYFVMGEIEKDGLI